MMEHIDEDKFKIYDGKSKAWYFLTISLADIPFGLVRQCDENSHKSWKALIDKYEVSYEKQESSNEVKKRWNNCRIKYKSQYPDIWFNELNHLSLKFKKIKEKCEKYEDELKAHVCDILPEY